MYPEEQFAKRSVAAGAVDLLARSVPGAMKRLAWSLGEPLASATRN